MGELNPWWVLTHAGVGVALWRKEGRADDMTHGSLAVASWAGGLNGQEVGNGWTLS